MKYTSLKYRESKEFEIPLLDGGINRYTAPEHLDKNQLRDGKNVWFKEGTLRTREGIAPNLNSIIADGRELYVIKGITFTDTVFYVGERAYRVCYCLRGDHVSLQVLHTFLSDGNGQLTPLGTMEFRRIADDEFYAFSNIFFYCGAKTKGAGLYAFLTRSCNVWGNIYSVYELSEDRNEWILLEETDFYIPIVYMNGRGNNYEDGIGVFSPILEEPISPENLNMLTGKFKCYFSSDEFSDCFKLPIKGLSESSAVECRVYYSPNSYSTWIIPANQNRATAKFYAATITMECDRSEGTVSFLDSENKPFPIPKMPNIPLNNVVITADSGKKEMEKIVGSTNVQIYGSYGVLYGNAIKPNEVYGVNLNNPLYFSEKMKTTVSNIEGPVVKMAVQQNKLIAFTDKELFRVTVKGQRGNKISTLIDTEYNFAQEDMLSSFPIHSQIGCFAPKTVTLCGNKLIWLGGEGKVYVLATTTFGKENNIYEISLPIRELLQEFSYEELKEAFAVEQDGYYMLFIGNKVFLLGYRIKNFGINSALVGLGDNRSGISWYMWEFPLEAKYCHGFNMENRVVLSCCSVPMRRAYTALLSGEADTIINSSGSMAAPTAITARFSTDKINLNSMEKLKCVEAIYFSYKGAEDLRVLIKGEEEELSCKLCKNEKISTQRIGVGMRSVNGISLNFEGKGPFSLGSGKVYYRETADVR